MSIRAAPDRRPSVAPARDQPVAAKIKASDNQRTAREGVCMTQFSNDDTSVAAVVAAAVAGFNPQFKGRASRRLEACDRPVLDRLIFLVLEL
jgi:hypothetical protein